MLSIPWTKEALPLSFCLKPFTLLWPLRNVTFNSPNTQMSIVGQCLFLEYRRGSIYHTLVGTQPQLILVLYKCIYPFSCNPLLLMNHCLTYKSLACLHHLCVMTTPGMTGRGLRKHCVRVHAHTCLHIFVCMCACDHKSQIRYQQGITGVSQLQGICQANCPTRQSQVPVGKTTKPLKVG